MKSTVPVLVPNWMSMTVLVQSSNNIFTITEKSSFSYVNFIIWALPEIIDYMQVIWVVVVQGVIVISQNCLE